MDSNVKGSSYTLPHPAPSPAGEDKQVVSGTRCGEHWTGVDGALCRPRGRTPGWGRGGGTRVEF